MPLVSISMVGGYSKIVTTVTKHMNVTLLSSKGLMHDDVLYETPDVEEAIRRLPTKLVDERNYRILRALQYSGLKKYLPKNEWTKYEEVNEINNMYICICIFFKLTYKYKLNLFNY